MIDTESYPRAWEEAFARGCLTETVARCKACDEPICGHRDDEWSGTNPRDGSANAVATSGGVSDPAGFHPDGTTEVQA